MAHNPILRDFSSCHILVVGDVMLDQYLWGTVSRISPEAPVPVFSIERRSQGLGGAANVAANLSGLKCKVSLVGMIGEDASGQILLSLLKSLGVDCPSIKYNGKTITKTRAITEGQQLIRLDEEDIRVCDEETEERILHFVRENLERFDAIILSDYGKGLIKNESLSGDIIQMGRHMGIPVLVDPKGKNWWLYKGATCITPNMSEFNLLFDRSSWTKEALSTAMKEIKARYELDSLLVTRGEKGMCLVDQDNAFFEIPTQAREVFDVSGAGDTVIATYAAGLAARQEAFSAARLANIAAGIVVGKVGTQPINASELQSAIALDDKFENPSFFGKVHYSSSFQNTVSAWKAASQKIVFTNGCFDLLHPGHIYLLHESRKMGDRLIVGLNSDASIRRLKGSSRPILTEQDRASLLGALKDVDLVIVFEQDTPLELINVVKPDILVKGADYQYDQIVGREEVEQSGGRVEIIPLLESYTSDKFENHLANNFVKRS